jgi:hypothetical protein
VLGPALVVGLWVVAAGLTIWILGPVVGFLLGRRRLEVDVHPESLIARPYPEDADGLRRYEQFLALGFRPVGWTSQHARFLTPLHWRWRSVQGSRWLASPDKRTFACIYRVVASEPARFGAVTLLEDEGSWETYYPGAGLKPETFGNRGRAEVRGVEPAELLAKHAEHVETFRRERGLGVRAATLAEVANATLTYAQAYLRKQGGAALLALPLGIFALPASFSFAMLARESQRARLAGALSVIFMALFYAVFRYGLLTLTKGWSARHMHTRAFELEQTAVAPDGTIVPGKHERWVRGIAILGVADMIARLVLIASKSAAIVRLGAGTVFVTGLMVFISASMLGDFIQRFRGRRVQRRGKAPQPMALWSTWAFLGVWMNGVSKNGFRPSRLIWLGVVGGFALLGWWLEKRGRK